MSILTRKPRQRRLNQKLVRSNMHRMSGRGKGKWHSKDTLWAYKLKSRRTHKIANASRRRNRRQ